VKPIARIVLAIVLTLAAQLAAQAPAFAVERILRFVSDVTVERNGDLTVIETIAVQAEGNVIKRGIFRDFPTRYTRPDGSRVEVGFEVASVTRDGQTENWVTENVSNGVRVRIGRAEVSLNTGPHEYVIRYRTTRQIGFFPDFDELYWNVTGNGWPFSIDQAEARIHVPGSASFHRTAFYTGPQGARGQDATIVQQQPGSIVIRTTRPLPPYNGLTIGVGWEKGLVDPPSATQQAVWLLRDNLALLAALLGLVLVVGYYVYAWNRVGRDPPTGTIIPLFKPPAGFSAAAVRYVDKMGFDNRNFTAAIIELGVNGRAKVVESGSTTTLLRRDGGKSVGAAEQTLEQALFKGRGSLQLKNTNHATISAAKMALKSALEASYKDKLFVNNFGWSGIGFLLAIAVLAAIVTAISFTYGSDNGPGSIAGLFIPIIPVMIGAGMVQSGLSSHSGGMGWVIGGVAIAALGLAVGISVGYASSRGWVDLVPVIVPSILAAIATLAIGWLQAPSVAGRRIMDEIDGFREYLGVAEEDRLEALNPPDKTPELFERFLPYAVALDVENSWGNRFAGVLAAAAAGAAAGYAASSWYEGNRDFSRDPASFADHVGGQLASTIASASTAPGSSSGGGGSGGGGSSGGGGGGGGGGGW
jgi:hypothetical protein